jgi:putative membrane protein
VKKFIQNWAINTLAVLVAVYLVPGIRFKDDSLWTPFVTSLVLGILNAFIRPILTLWALPLLILTLGFFRLLINALLLYFVSVLLGQYFEIDGFGAAFLGALVISIVSVLLNLLTSANRSRGHFEHRCRPPGSGRGGDGPVIDI